MKGKLRQLWEYLRFSYWFLPALMVISAVVLSFLSIQIDQMSRFEWVQNAGWVWSGGPEGARGLLSTVAGSMITVVSLTFSLTIVAFSQASSQFGPRLLGSLMKDTGNQFVLGVFNATFIYCLLVLRTIRTDNGQEFTPHISVTFAIFLALVSVGVLVYFIHHVAISIQAPYLVSKVAGDLLKTIDDHFPPENEDHSAQKGNRGNENRSIFKDEQRQAAPLSSDRNGYLQSIDQESLMKIATEQDLIFFFPYRPGHFVGEGSTLVHIWPIERLEDEVIPQIRDAFTFGPVRTYTQDVEFAIEQLVEVAVRSLSPGINDPFTAITCIDWLGTALKKLGNQSVNETAKIKDPDGKVRLIHTREVTFEGAVEAAFNQIRQNARTSVAVRIRLLETIAEIVQNTRHPEGRIALLEQARMIADVNEGDISQEKDRKDLTDWLNKIMDLQ